MPRISIIVATYNRAQQLLGTLESLVQQDLPAAEWECIVVDNNSKDDTQALFAEFAEANRGFNLRIVREERQGLSFARNRGVEESRGEIIASIDDDETVNEEFARGYLELFDKCEIAVAAGGRVVPSYPLGRPSWLSHLPRYLLLIRRIGVMTFANFRRDAFPQEEIWLSGAKFC